MNVVVEVNMGYTYVLSDCHGHYDLYKKMLDTIHFSDEDMLYMLGDVLDRGPKPISILFDLMKRPNCVCIAGNHECMACECLDFLLQDITDDSIMNIGEDIIEKLTNWQENGAASTLDEFHKLTKSEQEQVIEFIKDFEVYEEIHIGDKEYLLVHAGLRNFDKNREIWDYELSELVWERPDYQKMYFPDKIVITGHTPTLFIDSKDNKRPGYIYNANNHIAIDCGCGIPGGRLGCIRLEDMKEFYVENPV
ncbi:MAG: metallophosphoesterase [Lachnospira sp.]